MTLWNRFDSWFRSTLGRPRMESEMDAELRFHLEAYADDLVRGGMPREEALRRARIEFGAVERTKEECREARGLSFFDTLWQDFRYGARMLRKSPGFTTIAVLTLAIGIGANATIFSVVYGVLLAPLPYRAPERLALLNETTPKVGTVSVSYPDFLDWRSQSHQFSQMAAVYGVRFNLAGVSQPESIRGEAVSSNFLSVLGMRPFLGRDFDVTEDKASTAPVVMLSYSLWESHLGADPSAIGRAIMLDGRGFTIIGVLPSSFRWTEKADFLEPIGVWGTGNTEMTERDQRGDMVVLGRLAPGATFPQVRAEMNGIAERIAEEYPGSNAQFGAVLRPIRDAYVNDVKPAILSLFGAVLCVLLIACANVANLLLVRGASRTREIALRIAFGATRKRVIRQMLTESFVLAFFGGGLGILLAYAGIRGITSLLPDGMLMGASVGLNSMVLLFAGALIMLAAFIFGLAPAARSAKADVQLQLKEGGAGAGTGTAQTRLRGLFVVAELALSLILLAGAGLMMKSLHLLLSVSPGFQTDRVLTMEMDLRSTQYDKDPAIRNFWQQVLDRVRALPGIQSAATGTAVPLTDNHNRTDITIEGMPVAKPGGLPHPDVHVVSDEYASTLHVPLLRGRTFTEMDNENAPMVGLINEKLAREFFRDGDAVGKRFMFGRPSAGTPPQWLTIVGVLGDTKLYGLANPARFEVYLPFRQAPSSDMDLLVRSSVDAAALTSAIRGEIASIDKDQPIFAISTMSQLMDDSVSTRRFTLILLGLFSGLALVLAAIGIYGVISYTVAQRTRDIGIRMALGATQRDVLRDVLGFGVRLTCIGMILGLLGAFAATRVLASLLYGVHSTDAVTFTAVSLVLMVVALFASYLPARRATRVDPIVALRYE
ncbi:MAG: ABC transporter permease [Candidatus Acidiferrum sp.]